MVQILSSQNQSINAQTIFRGIASGEPYIEEPSWTKWMVLVKNVCPEIVEYPLKYLFLRYLKPAYSSANDHTHGRIQFFFQRGYK